MAKKLDFTQKLLDDLRLRKEQLAMAQSSQHQGRKPATNAYESFNRSSRGSGERNPSRTNGLGNRPNSTTPQKWSNPGHHKSTVAAQSSQEIVLFEKPGRNSNSFSDLSMALAFAIENGWNFTNMDFSRKPMVGKKLISHNSQRSLGSSEMSSSRYTWTAGNPSYLQIREISKGAQKLNQILKSCCNGINFDRYSIDVGKELLKGAMDLEESLRMLVNLQAASDYMVSPRRKPVRLVEEGEEEEEGAIEVYGHKPRFSFDGLSRNSTVDLREIAKNSFFKQHLLAITSYSSSNSKMSKVDSGRPSQNQVSSRRSMSLDLDSSAGVSNPGTKGRGFSSKEFPTPASSSKNVNKIKQSDSRRSEQDKGRLPNVIAKLMGLEELPPKSESRKSGQQKVPSTKHGAGNGKILDEENSKDVDLITKNLERLKSQIEQEDKILESRKTTVETVQREGKANQAQKTTQNLHVVPSTSQKSILKVDQEKNTPRIDKVIESQEAKKDNERTENPKPKVQKNMKNGDVMLSHPQKTIFKSDFQSKVKVNGRPAAVDVEHETEERNGSLYQKEQKKENDVVARARNPQKPVQELESEKPYIAQKSDGRDTKHGKVEREENSRTQPKIKQGKSDFLTIEKAPSRGLKEKRALQGYLKTDTDKAPAPIPTIVAMKPVQIQSAEKFGTNEIQKQQREKPIKIESRRRKDVSPRAMDRPSRRDEKTSKTKEALISSTPLMPKYADPSSSSSNPRTDGRRSPQEVRQTIAPVSNASSPNPSRTQLQLMQGRHDIEPSSKISTALQLPDVLLKEDMSWNSNFKAIQPEGPTNRAIISHSSTSLQPDSHMTKSITEYQERPIVHENHLKQLLIKSPHFLNAAEALFKLHIPVNILHKSSHKSQDGDSKLVLDCAYEIMMRKGRRKELAFYPLAELAIVSMEVKSLDDLVRELDEDLEQLKFCDCSGGHDQDTADQLHRMLKTDIQSSNLDINCMWDIGWICTMFAEREKDEVVRDVEKLVFNGLLNEITGDLLHI